MKWMSEIPDSHTIIGDIDHDLTKFSASEKVRQRVYLPNRDIPCTPYHPTIPLANVDAPKLSAVTGLAVQDLCWPRNGQSSSRLR